VDDAQLARLAALGIGFLVIQGGMGWDALVGGPSGDRMQSLANVIAGERPLRPARLALRSSTASAAAYNVDFFLLRSTRR
jgi:hypothetical protein